MRIFRDQRSFQYDVGSRGPNSKYRKQQRGRFFAGMRIFAPNARDVRRRNFSNELLHPEITAKRSRPSVYILQNIARFTRRDFLYAIPLNCRFLLFALFQKDLTYSIRVFCVV